MRLHQPDEDGKSPGRGIARIVTALLPLDPKWRCQQAEGQGDGQEDDLQDAVNGDAEDAEREQYQPDEGVGNQGEQGQRPAEDEKNAPEQESEQGEASFFLSG